MRPFIIGTAGHIDHGKSSLVQALTGTNPDRLPEEQRRGITIELGFASGALNRDVSAAYVDVPGHEKFVRTMVAGASGVDVVLFVVAIDEGIMPQTREHADICRLLALPKAVVALTKDDLAPQLDPEWVGLVTDDIRQLGEPFTSAPLVRVSARTGTGLDALKRTLAKVASSLPPRPTTVPPMLPIDRVFTLKGHGTIVTGTLLSGALSVGDEVELVAPSPRKATLTSSLRARSLQVHGQTVPRAKAGQRVAVNLPGVEVSRVSRGSALVAAGTGLVRQGALLDVVVEAVASTPPLANRSRWSIHLGTAQALATLDLLGLSELEPGTQALAQLRLDRALPFLRDQRFVLRGFRTLARGGQTVAGGRVLWGDRRRRRAADRSFIEALVTTPMPAIVRDAGARGVARAELALQLNGLPKEAATDEVLFDTTVIGSLAERLRILVQERREVPREEAESALGPGVHPSAFSAALARLGPDIAIGEMLSTGGLRTNPLEQTIDGILAGAGLSPPTAGELAAQLKTTPYAVGGALRGLAKAGKAVRLTDELFVHADAAAEFRTRVIEALTVRGSLTTLELKEMAGVSRKFAIPLCEWLDREHVTIRSEEKRTLRG